MKNTFVKVLSFLMALTMIVGAFGAITVSAAECAHDNATAGEVVAPKCNAVGYTWYTCDDCGASFKGDFRSATGTHVPVNYFYDGTSASATCTTPAYNAGKKCSDCGTVIALPTEKTGASNAAKKHNFADGTFVDRTYCTDATYVEYRCTRCGLSAEKCEEADAAGTFAPTGKTYDDFAKITISAAGTHDWTEYTVVSAPANGCASTTVTRSCTVCPKTETVVTAHSHNYVEYDHRNDANYCGDYIYWKQCSKCNDVIGQIANAGKGTDHALVNVATLPTDLAFLQFNAANNNRFTSDASLSQTATCKQAGWQVKKCSLCGAYSLSTIGIQSHKYDESAYIRNDDTTQGLEAADLGGVANHGANDKGKACTTAIAIVRKCKWYSACKEVEIVSVITAAVQHNYTVDANRDGKADGIVTTAATCTANGYTTYSCQNAGCNVEYVQDYTAALGHTMSAAYYCDATGNTTVAASALKCTEGIYQRTMCTRTGCTYKTDVETVFAPASTHVLSQSKTKDVAATCQTGAYKYYACANSDLCTITSTAIEGTVGTTLNPNNHDLTGAVQLTAKTVAATCTTAEKQIWSCKCGADVEKTVGSKLNHNYGTTAAPNRTYIGADGVSGTEDDVNLSAVAATCLKTGLTAGVICARCGDVKTSQTVTQKNPNNHVSAANVAQTGTTIATYAATCLKPAYKTVRYDGCCDAKVDVKTNGNTLGSCNPVAVGALAPTCTEVGYHPHNKCSVCGKITNATFGNTVDCGDYHTAAQHAVLANSTIWTDADVTIPALGHDFSVDVPRQEAVCVVTGWDANNKATAYTSENGYTAHKACSVCGEENAYSILRAHAREEKVYEGSAPTCTTPGFNAGTYCKICVNIEGTVDYNKAHAGVAATGHAYGSDATDTSKYIYVNVKSYTAASNVSSITVTAVVDCTAPAYVLRKCTNDGCSEMNMVPGSYVAANAGHDWTFAADNHPVQTTAGALDSANWTFACWGSSYTSKDCTRCDAVSEKVYANDQVKHYYYVAGVLTEINTNCAAIANFDAVTCALCGLEVVAGMDALDAYAADGYIGADHNYVTETVPATCTTIGYSTTYCTTCRVEKGEMTTTAPYNPTMNPFNQNGTYNNVFVKAVVKRVNATATTAGYVDYFCAKCDGRHTYVIPATGVTTTYNASVVPSATTVASGNTLTLTVKIQAVKDITFNSIKLNLDDGSNNLLTIVGAELNYNFDGNMYVDFTGSYLNIYTEHNADGKPVNVTMTAGDFVDFVTLTVVTSQYSNGTTGELKATLTNGIYYKADGTTAAVTLNAGSQTRNKVAVYGVGELNGDGVIAGVSDIQKLIALYNAGSDDAVADINRDGVVNGQDIVALRKYSVSNKMAIDYLTMIGVDLDAAIAAAKTPNMDKNNVIDVNDEILFAAAIKNKLTTMTVDAYFALGYDSIEACILGLTASVIPNN